jgi:hypothetical protein
MTLPLEKIMKVALGLVFQVTSPLNLALLYLEGLHLDAKSANLKF